ncbi:hypothetical protein [Undibacterium sp. TC9W]|uniref:hypothetical protein n=1 Tax=Undibacterium sp. TC9W TaxID=3413053 RepID=UPI003BF32FCD
MKFSSDELMPFSEVRTRMSHFLVNVHAGKDIIITRYAQTGKSDQAQSSLMAQVQRAEQLLARLMDSNQ